MRSNIGQITPNTFKLTAIWPQLTAILTAFDRNLTAIWPHFDHIWPGFDRNLTGIWPYFDLSQIWLEFDSNLIILRAKIPIQIFGVKYSGVKYWSNLSQMWVKSKCGQISVKSKSNPFKCRSNTGQIHLNAGQIHLNPGQIHLNTGQIHLKYRSNSIKNRSKRLKFNSNLTQI